MIQSYSKNNTSLQTELISLLKINETYSNYHKKILNILKSSEPCTSPVIPTQHLKNKVVLENQTIENLITYSRDLLETDFLHIKILKSLSNSVNTLGKTLQISNSIKKNLGEMKIFINSLNSYFSESFKKLSVLPESFKNTKKIKNCLLKIFSAEFLLGKKKMNIEDGLVESLKVVVPENQNTVSKVKKMKQVCEEYKKTLLGVGKHLLQINCFNENAVKRDCSPVTEKNEEGVKKAVLKNVNRLLNRGSLTKEEAKRVILNLNKDTENIENLGRERENHTEGSPLTETRIKPGNNRSSFHCEIEKALKVTKKSNKSCSVFKRRKSTNPSLPRNLSISFLKPSQTSSKSKIN